MRGPQNDLLGRGMAGLRRQNRRVQIRALSAMQYGGSDMSDSRVDDRIDGLSPEKLREELKIAHRLVGDLTHEMACGVLGDDGAYALNKKASDWVISYYE